MIPSTPPASPRLSAAQPAWSERRIVLVLLLIATVLHGAMLAGTALAARDTIGFVDYALQLESQSWPQVIRHQNQHPGYPAMVLAVSWPVRYFLGKTPEAMGLSAQLVSALAGILLVIPLYYLTRQWVGRRESFAAALIFLVLPVSLRVTSDGLSEGPFLLMVTAGICFGAQAYRLGSPWRLMLCGLFGGLAYLIRPEGSLVVAGALLVLIAVQILRSYRWPWRNWIGAVSGLTVAAGLVAAPYTLVIGGFTRKPTGKEIMAPAAGDESSPGTVGRSMPAVGAPLLACLLGVRWDAIDSTHQPSLAWCLGAIADETARTFEWFLFLPFLFGMWKYRDNVRMPQGWLLLAVGLLHVAVLVRLVVSVGYISERHTLLLALVCMPMIAGSLVTWGDALWSKFGGRWLPARWDGGLAAVLLVAGLLLPSAMDRLHANASGHRAAGAWLAGHAQPRDWIVDPFSWAEYYSGRTLQGEPPIRRSMNRTCWVIVESYARPHPCLPVMEKARQLAERGVCVFRCPASNPKSPTVEVYEVTLREGERLMPNQHSPRG